MNITFNPIKMGTENVRIMLLFSGDGLNKASIPRLITDVSCA